MLLYETAEGYGKRELYWTRASFGDAVRLSNPLSGGLDGVVQGSARFAAGGKRVFYLSREDSGQSNHAELYLVSVNGTPSAPVGVHGGTVPGTMGVSDYSLREDGGAVLFLVDTGDAPDGKELFHSTISGTSFGTPTEVAGNDVSQGLGVSLFRLGFLGGSRAAFLNDDVQGFRPELFFVDTTGTPTVTRVPGQGTFPTPAMGVLETALVVDGSRILFVTDQASSPTFGVSLLYIASLSGSPSPQMLGTTDGVYSGLSVLGRDYVAYTTANATPGNHLWREDLGGTTATQLSGSEVDVTYRYATGADFLSADSILYRVESSLTSDYNELFLATVGSGVATQTRLSSADRIVRRHSVGD